MIYGFTFNNKHSSEFGLYVKTNTRTLKAQEKTQKEDIQLRNGSYVFKTGWEDREINLKLTLLNTNYKDRKKQLRDIAEWLTTDKKQALIFDDEPEIFYLGQINTALNTAIDTSATDTFDLTFECEPFKYEVLDTSDLIFLGEAIELGSVVPLGIINNKTFDIETRTINFDLNSTAPIERYIIELEGVMNSIQINNMVLSNVSGRYKIDLFNKIVYKINLDNTIENAMVDFNKDWDFIDYKSSNYQVNLIVNGLVSQNKITFFFTNTYL